MCNPVPINEQVCMSNDFHENHRKKLGTKIYLRMFSGVQKQLYLIAIATIYK